MIDDVVNVDDVDEDNVQKESKPSDCQVMLQRNFPTDTKK